jgi:threonine/homoserine/homoserine lactone efflux protein
MTTELLLAFMAYAFVTSITPGPNNTMLLVSGANFGFGPTVPHLLGVAFGFSAMVLAVGLGVGSIFVLFPPLHAILRYGGALYLLYLAWKIATSGGLGGGDAAARPMRFLQAVAFQWINPKAWIMAIGAVATYTPQNGYFLNIAIVSLIYLIINAPCIAAWAGFGTVLRGLLRQPLYLRLFNVGMALLLVASLYPLLMHA